MGRSGADCPSPGRNQPAFITAELAQIRRQGQRLCLDGDLTGLPMSNTGRTFPNAAYGHMNTEIRLGYQAALVSMESPTYGRLWLSVAHHPGDTVSCTQAEGLVLAAEQHTGLRPRRRTELLRQRIREFEQAMAVTDERLAIQQKAVQQAGERLASTQQQFQERQQQLAELEQTYQARHLVERPHSRLSGPDSPPPLTTFTAGSTNLPIAALSQVGSSRLLGHTVLTLPFRSSNHHIMMTSTRNYFQLI